MGFSKPSRIQAETLPMILGKPPQHLIAQAHNGSGKTTCFVLGMLSRCDPNLHKPQALCICPTRELVVQNVDVLRKMATYTGITCMHTAAADDKAQAAQSRMPPITDQVVIATPGRLITWITRKTMPVKCVLRARLSVLPALRSVGPWGAGARKPGDVKDNPTGTEFTMMNEICSHHLSTDGFLSAPPSAAARCRLSALPPHRMR
jgi:hypothetical protein